MLLTAGIGGDNWYCISAFAIGAIFSYLEGKIQVRLSRYIRMSALIICVVLAVVYLFHFKQNWFLDNVESNINAFGLIVFVSLLSELKHNC